MYIVSAFNEKNQAKFEVVMDTFEECQEWIREIKRDYTAIKSFKIFDNYDSHKKGNWRAFIKT